MTDEIEPTVLYGQDRIKVTDWPQEIEGHFLYIGTNDPERGYALMRGVLKDLGRRLSLEGLEGSLDQINPGIMHSAREEGIEVSQIRLALNQARIRELELQSTRILKVYGERDSR